MNFAIYDRCFIYDRMYGFDVLKTIVKLGRNDYLKSIFGSNAEGLLTDKSNVYFLVGNSTTEKKKGGVFFAKTPRGSKCAITMYFLTV